MNLFAPEAFFNLDDFAHRDIFIDGQVEHVWDVLTRIGDYLQSELRPALLGDIHPGAYLMSDEIYAAPGVIIEPGAYIDGPTLLGPGTVVRHGAYIRGNVITGENCIIGHATEVKNAIMLNGSGAPHFAYVGDSVLGGGVNLGAGSRLANFKLHGEEVTVRLDNETYHTGLRKFGAILGDKVSVGCNTVFNPGTLIGPNSSVYGLSFVRGYHPANSFIKTE